MRKFITFAIILIMTIACFAACKSGPADTPPVVTEESPLPVINPTADPENNVSNQVLTLEYALEHSKLTEADLDGIDFNDFVAHYKLTTEDLKEYEIESLLRMYKENLNTVILDYSYIFNDNTEDKLTENDFDHINAIVWKYNEGNYVDSMIIDILKGEAYSGTGWDCELIYKYGELDPYVTAFPWTDDLTEKAKAFLSESGIINWDKVYDGENVGTGHFIESIAFLLDDGRIISYHDNGMTSKAPEEMFALIENLNSLKPAA